MAFHLAEVAGANTDLLNAFHPAGPVAARGQFARAVVPRNDSSAVPTVNMFIDGVSESMEWAASIVDACGGQTTYALRCTSGPSYMMDQTTCGSNAPAVTVTANSATYILSTATVTRTLGRQVSATMQESCALQGTTQAVCAATIGGTVDGQAATTSATTTFSGTDYYRYDVAITGGAEKTASATAECKPKGNSAASTKAMAMWGLVVGAAGVASLLGL